MDSKKANKKRVLDLYRKRAGYSKEDIAKALKEADTKIEECKKNNDEAGVLTENKNIGKYMLEMNLSALYLMDKNADNTFIKGIVKNELYSLIVLENKLQFDDIESLKVATNKMVKENESMANVYDLYRDMQKESDIMSRDINSHTQNIVYNIIKWDTNGDVFDHYKLIYASKNNTCVDVNMLADNALSAMNEVIAQAKEDIDLEIVAMNAVNKFKEDYATNYGGVSEGEAIRFALSKGYITVSEFTDTILGSNKVMQSMKDIPLLKTVKSGKVLYSEFCDKLVIDDIEFDYAMLSKAYYENTIPESKRIASVAILDAINYHEDKSLNESLRTAILNGANEIMNKTIAIVAEKMDIPVPKAGAEVIEDARILAIAYVVAETINTMLLDTGLMANGIILTRGFYDDMVEANTVFVNKVIACIGKYIEGKTDFDLTKEVEPEEVVTETVTEETPEVIVKEEKVD